MRFYGEKIEELPEVSYIAVLGPLEKQLTDELIQRVKRIKNADPQKNVLALDIKGLRDVKKNHLPIFNNLQKRLEQFGWGFYICNIPGQYHNIFFSDQFKHNLNVSKHKKDLIKHFHEQNNSKQKNHSIKPIDVGIRASEGVRIFEGQATSFQKENDTLTIFTNDKNAVGAVDKKNVAAEIYFPGQKVQILPAPVALSDCKKTSKNNYNYKLSAQLKEINETDRSILSQHF